jgi:hypothetical protein
MSKIVQTKSAPSAEMQRQVEQLNSLLSDERTANAKLREQVEGMMKT